MAQVRGHWFPILGRALQWHGLMDLVGQRVPPETRALLAKADPLEWYDERNVVAVYEAAAAARDLVTVRNLGRYAARLALQTAWFSVFEPVLREHGRSPSRAFQELHRLWTATRMDAGELRCIDSGPRHAVTELRGFPHGSSGAWAEAWLGHHEALLRHLRFAGQAEVEPTSAARSFILRTRTTWAGALSGVPTSGRIPPP